MVRKPSIYLDTSIIRNIAHRRNNPSIFWGEQIRQNKWVCVTSIFGIMEVLDNEQDDKFLEHNIGILEFNDLARSRNRRKLESSHLDAVKTTVNNFRMAYPFLDVVSMDNDAWKLALHICANSNIFATDSIHLAVAWQNNCDLLITSDNHFVEEGKKLLVKEKVWSKMRICTPEKVRVELKGLKFGGLP